MDTYSNEFFIFITAIFGLTVGSFLNVVIHRLPLMLKKEWIQQSYEALQLPSPEEKQQQLTLSYPSSHCPHCQHKIRFYENIPVLSYLFLRGKCASCHAGISIQYPCIELITAILSATIGWHYGFSWQALAMLFLTWGFIAHTMIDIKHLILPDDITYPLLWLGLLCNSAGLFTDAQSSIIGAAVGYLSLWTVYHGFKLITGKEGMGYGDFKLLALIGAWGGWQILPQVVLLSSVVGAIIGIALLVIQKKSAQTPLPFGPYLTIAGWVSLLWGSNVTAAYLGLF